jgi:hypothetical protein
MGGGPAIWKVAKDFIVTKSNAPVSRKIANKQGLLHFGLRSVIGGGNPLCIYGAFMLEPRLSAVRRRPMRRIVRL